MEATPSLGCCRARGLIIAMRRSGQPVAGRFGPQSVDAIGGEAAHQEVVHRAVLSFTARGAPYLMDTMALKGGAAHQENPLDVVVAPFIRGRRSGSTAVNPCAAALKPTLRA